MSQPTSDPLQSGGSKIGQPPFERIRPLRNPLGWFASWRSIRSKIVAVAIALIVFMLATSVASMLMSATVSILLEELTSRYVPAYGHLARANVRSLERALALRRVAAAKMQVPPDDEGYEVQLRIAAEKGSDVAHEADKARKLINAIIDDARTPSDNAALGRLDARIENATSELRQELSEEEAKLLEQLNASKFPEARQSMARIDLMRDQLIRKIDEIRSDMLAQVHASSSTVIQNQHRVLATSVVVSLLAALLGIGVAMVVASGITRPVRELLRGTRDVELGRLDGGISVSTADEIGELSVAFNRMLEQLRKTRHARETFGRYIDPKVAERLLDWSGTAVPDGQRRVMTVMFCDIKGFTSLSEGMTPQGLVKVLNFFLSTMSEPIRASGGIVDKYIGDAIMAYWGSPFVDDAEQASLACAAACEMVRQLPTLRCQFPELLGLRHMPGELDIRIGIATGEVVAGSIGSELMMSYTVMGDAVILAARLESLNKVYGTRILVAARTAQMARDAFEFREVDRVIVYGHEAQTTVHEPIGKVGELSAAQEALQTAYGAGLDAYRQQRWKEAREAFERAQESVPGDGPSRVLLSRIQDLETRPQTTAWDGSWRMDRK
ncbi:adenylate/guanylate cyclase domain-containing protein [Methylobacterium nigriterrae]|uniref:adenylate/guanylate cyclase domain-containing protein n=1 Tax=Methylobacterium nigriterrae TaxID=3127512 RepID=UPI0030140AB9